MSTQYGPLSALDRDFITKVRLAGLWELPAGQQAQQKGTTAGRTHGGAAPRRGAHLPGRSGCATSPPGSGSTLPNQPSDQQKQWLATLNAAQGADYDREFANILRLAHGKVFSVVAQVRATTRNSLVRALADDANTTVLDHIKVLEATGYVDFDALARDMAAASTPPLTSSPAPPGPATDPRPAAPAHAVVPDLSAAAGRLQPAAATAVSPVAHAKRNVTYRQRSVRIVNRAWRPRSLSHRNAACSGSFSCCWPGPPPAPPARGCAWPPSARRPSTRTPARHRDTI